MALEPDFRAFVTERSGALFRSAYLLTGDRHTAEDLVQTALAKTAAKFRSLNDPSALEGYVRRVMYNEQVSSWRRRRQLTEVAVGHLPDQIAEGHADTADLRLVMRGALARLTPKQRAMLVLRYFEDLSEAEIARVLGMRIGTVRSQIYRSLERLRKVAPELSAVRELR